MDLKAEQTEKPHAAAGADTASRLSGGSVAAPEPPGADLPSLARLAVETFVLERRIVEPRQAATSSLLRQRSACFVCIKTAGRDLRGCVGTVDPERDSLAEEVVSNAVKAATRDPRFPPVSSGELRLLRYSVDVLGALEPTRLEDLDPSVFGLVVVGESGARRGLLLPDIEGIVTPAQQVGIASRKAGIAPHESFKLYRFRTRRFSETA